MTQAGITAHPSPVGHLLASLTRYDRIVIALIGLAAIGRLVHHAYLTGWGSDPGYGVDGGAYAMSVLNLLGHQQYADFVRPPLNPGALLAPFTLILGHTLGTIVWANLTAGLMHAAVAWWSRSHLQGWRWVVLVAATTFESLNGHLIWAGAVVMLPTACIYIGMRAIDYRQPWVLFASTVPLGILNMPLLAAGAVMLGGYWAQQQGFDRRMLIAGLSGGIISLFLFAPWWLMAFRAPLYAQDELNFVMLPLINVAGLTLVPLLAGAIAAANLRRWWLCGVLGLGVVSTLIIPADESLYNPQLRLMFALVPLAMCLTIERGLPQWLQCRIPKRAVRFGITALLVGGFIGSFITQQHLYVPVPAELKAAYDRIEDESPGARIFTNDRISAYYNGAWNRREVDWVQFALGVPVALRERERDWRMVTGDSEGRIAAPAYIIDRKRDRPTQAVEPTAEIGAIAWWEWLKPQIYWRYAIPRSTYIRYDYPCWVRLLSRHYEGDDLREFDVRLAEPAIRCNERGEQ